MKDLIDRLTTYGDRGASMVEYALLVSLISVVSVTAVAMVGHRTEETFDNMAVALGSEAPTGQGEEAGPGSGPGAGNPDDYDPDYPGDPDPDDPDNPDDPGQGGDETGDPAGNDPTGQGSKVEILDTSAELTEWRGNQGTWSALVTFANDWDHDQELTVEVTPMDSESGAQPTTTLTVKVASRAQSILALEDHQLSRKGKDFNGIVAVEVRVVSVTTNDADGQPMTYTFDEEPSTTVDHPTP